MYKLLLEFTSVEQHRWHDWFEAHHNAWTVPFASGRMATIGGVVHHVFAVELRYVQRLRDERVTEWDEFRETSIEGVFELGDFARASQDRFFLCVDDRHSEPIECFRSCGDIAKFDQVLCRDMNGFTTPMTISWPTIG